MDQINLKSEIDPECEDVQSWAGICSILNSYLTNIDQSILNPKLIYIKSKFDDINSEDDQY